MGLIDDIVIRASRERASDVHMAAGLPLRFRVDGKLSNADETVLTCADCRAICEEIVTSERERLDMMGEIDLAGTYGNGTRCRVNIYHSMGNLVVALRLLNDRIPPLASLGLPPVMMEFPAYRKGIVIITGVTGSGKSTTLASLLDEVNHTRYDHIITLEDPIEYLYTPDKCSIDQRAIGRDTASYADGLRASLREDPDVILIGEMRDLDTIETALTAAETGHLVFATLHTSSAVDSIDRMVDVFPAGRQKQIRLQLSQTIKAVVSQQLLVRREGTGRIAVCEVMIVNPAIRNLIREDKTPQMQNTLATSAQEGSITMDNMLIQMAKAKNISRATAVGAAHDPEYVNRLVRA
jgi:twitching motility protein PilT